MEKLRVLSLFSGVGGLDLGLERTGGFETVAFCERELFCIDVLKRHWPKAPVYDDVCTLSTTDLVHDGVGPIDVICGGFPCQDISFAGLGAGLDGDRSGLWSEFKRLIRDLRPIYVVVENVAALLHRGLSRVLGDLAGLGYDAEWSTVSACSVRPPHVRQRLFMVAYPNGQHGREGLWNTAARSQWALQAQHDFEGARARSRTRLANPSALYGGADGLPNGSHRNRGIGNAVSPPVGELIGRAILEARAAA